MQPYVIKQGDYLAKLAYQFGFDAATVWMDDKNSDLRTLRPNPNILYPSDVLYIPEQSAGAPEGKTLAVGQTNTFTSDAPTIQVVVQFKGSDSSTYASQPFQVEELPDLTGLQTEGDGTATIDVPVTLLSINVTFPNAGTSHSILIADMDPINTLSGIFKRLQNLGCICQDAVFDENDLETLRAALRTLKAVPAPGPGSDPSAASPAGDPSAASSDTDQAADATPPPAGSSGAVPADSSSVESDDSSEPADSSTNSPSVQPVDAGNSPAASQDGQEGSDADDGGLSDAGELDDATTALLLQHHGS